MANIFELQDVFPGLVRDKVSLTNCSYIEAILELCTQHDMEPEAAASLLDGPLIQKLQAEGEDINILPETSKLPFDGEDEDGAS